MPFVLSRRRHCLAVVLDFRAAQLLGIEFLRRRCFELEVLEGARAVFGVAASRVVQEFDVAVGDAEVDLAGGEVYDEAVDSGESCVEG